MKHQTKGQWHTCDKPDGSAEIVRERESQILRGPNALVEAATIVDTHNRQDRKPDAPREGR